MLCRSPARAWEAFCVRKCCRPIVTISIDSLPSLGSLALTPFLSSCRVLACFSERGFGCWSCIMPSPCSELSIYLSFLLKRS